MRASVRSVRAVMPASPGDRRSRSRGGRREAAALGKEDPDGYGRHLLGFSAGTAPTAGQSRCRRRGRGRGRMRLRGGHQGEVLGAVGVGHGRGRCVDRCADRAQLHHAGRLHEGCHAFGGGRDDASPRPVATTVAPWRGSARVIPSRCRRSGPPPRRSVRIAASSPTCRSRARSLFLGGGRGPRRVAVGWGRAGARPQGVRGPWQRACPVRGRERRSGHSCPWPARSPASAACGVGRRGTWGRAGTRRPKRTR